MEKNRLFILSKAFIIDSMYKLNHVEGVMKALFLSDEINQTHWGMLKSALLILSLLPICQLLLQLWQGTIGESKIVVGFMAISTFSALTIVAFISALLASVLQLKHQSEMTRFEQRILQVYRYVPMLLLTCMICYLTVYIIKNAF